MRNIRNVPGHFSGLIELWRDLLWYISDNSVYVARTDERDIGSFFLCNLHIHLCGPIWLIFDYPSISL